MKIQKTAMLFFVGWATMCVSACGFGYYKAISQPASPSVDIQKANEFKVRPLSYAKITYADLGYASEAAMKEEFANFATDFAAYFQEMWKVEGVPEKKIIMVGAADEVKDGILVETEVNRIQLNWNAFTNNPDDFFITVNFTDAASKNKLFSGQYQVKSSSASQRMLGIQTMQSRLTNAAYNMVWVVIKIMSKGVAAPVQY